MASAEPVLLVASGSHVTVLVYYGFPRRARLRSQDFTGGEQSISTDNRLISSQGFVKVATMPSLTATLLNLSKLFRQLVRKSHLNFASLL